MTRGAIAPAPRWLEVASVLHLAYLLALPAMGLAALRTGARIGPAVLAGWIAVVVYVAATSRGYRLARHPARALVVVLAVPLQVGAGVLLVGADLPWFWYESAVLQVGALCAGLALAMIWHRPSGVGGAVVGVLIAAAWLPYALPLVRVAGTWPLGAQVLLGTSAVTAVAVSTRLFAAAAGEHVRTGAVVEVDVEHGNAGLAAWLGDDAGAIEPPLAHRWARRLMAVVIVGGIGAAWTLALRG